MSKELEDEIDELRQQLHGQEVRLNIAQAWIDFMKQAFDAMVFYSINYRNLRAYQDEVVWAEANRLPVTRAQQHITLYIGRLQNDLRAAVRRKGFRQV